MNSPVLARYGRVFVDPESGTIADLQAPTKFVISTLAGFACAAAMIALFFIAA